jgi:hypothetical protein
MARRNHTKGNLLKPGIFAAIGILLCGVAIFLIFGSGSSLGKLPPFPVQSYMDGGNLWSAEDYALSGKVDNVLLRSDDRSTYLVSIRPNESDFVVPVIFETESTGGTPVHREQKLLLKVHLGSSGEIRCTALE